MNRTNEKPFDCLVFNWRTEAEVYREIKDLSAEQQIEYFRRHAEAGPFA